MPSDNGPSVPPRRTRILVTVGITALVVAFVVLHLTGVLGPGTH